MFKETPSFRFHFLFAAGGYLQTGPTAGPIDHLRQEAIVADRPEDAPQTTNFWVRQRCFSRVRRLAPPWSRLHPPMDPNRARGGYPHGGLNQGRPPELPVTSRISAMS